MSHLLECFSFLEYPLKNCDEQVHFPSEEFFAKLNLGVVQHDVVLSRNFITGEMSEPDWNLGQNCANHDLSHGETKISKKKINLSVAAKSFCQEFLNRSQNKVSLETIISDSKNTMLINSSIIELTNVVTSKFLAHSSSISSQLFFSTIDEAGSVNKAPKLHQPQKQDIKTTKKNKTYAVLENITEELPPLNKLIENPAYQWEFELDTFQKKAILCLERNQSVFVAAHTSAGKTVVAEYACALCRRRGSKVIYTSPIKALSNQKFYDFRRTFGENVGLITGDIKLAPESSLLVMTTEILHNMICDSAKTIQDLEIVIMDEVHYINDVKRGHIWEQIMIMLPKHVILVMLSATLPNKTDFADWLGRIRDCEIHVIATHKRPVPLEHYLYTGLDSQNTSQHLHLIVDRNDIFNMEGYKKAEIFTKRNDQAPLVKTQKNAKSPDTKNQHRKQTGGKVKTPGNFCPFPSAGTNMQGNHSKNMWLGIICLLKERDLLPAIAFSFSRSSLETLVNNLNSVDLLDHNEKKDVKQFLYYALTKNLKKSEQKLTSVLLISQLVMRGLGIHHAGMLPLLKETVEMLFQRGLIRLLFSTETFAMGVNMPARCVIFTSLEKFDGHARRPLNPSEYTQMAGRAGRRGLDAAGSVIILLEGIGKSVTSSVCQLPSSSTLSNIILGKPTQLVSKFKITYSMITHLHRSNWMTPQDMMRQSFMEAASLRREHDLKKWLSILNSRLSKTTTLIPSAGSSLSTSVSKKIFSSDRINLSFGEPISQVKCPFGELSCCDTMATYYQACCNFRQLNKTMSRFLANQNMTDLQRVFCPGRVVFIQLSSYYKSIRETRKSKQTNWLVPAIIIDLIKEQNELHLNLITWQLPNITIDTLFHSSVTSNEPIKSADDFQMNQFDVANEEEILKDGEDRDLSTTPYPPQLMPVFKPESLEDGLSRLTFISEYSTRYLVRVCDYVVTFKSRTATKHPNVKLADQLKDAIKKHLELMALSELGMHVIKSKKSDNEVDRELFVTNINQQLFDMVTSMFTNLSTESMISSIYGLPPNQPSSLNLEKALKSKANLSEYTSIFEELSLLGEELTTPLLGSTIYQRLAPIVCPDLVAHFDFFHLTCRRRWAIKRLEESLSDSRLQLNAEYLGRLHVLEELGFIDSATQSGYVTLKGRISCEITKMEVLLTQLLLDGSFTHLLPPDIAAILSCFVFETRSSDINSDANYLSNLLESCKLVNNMNNSNDFSKSNNYDILKFNGLQIPTHLQPIVMKVLQSAIQLEELQRKYGIIDSNSDTYVNISLIGAVYAWAKGCSFYTFTSLTNVSEGDLVKTLLQLDELLRHIYSACYHLGDKSLSLKMQDARNAIRRDVVCTQSLYVSDEFV